MINIFFAFDLPTIFLQRRIAYCCQVGWVERHKYVAPRKTPLFSFPWQQILPTRKFASKNSYFIVSYLFFQFNSENPLLLLLIKCRVDGERANRVDWHNVTVFSPQLRQQVQSFGRKGAQVLVMGRVAYNEYVAPDGKQRNITNIIANEVTFVRNQNKTNNKAILSIEHFIWNNKEKTMWNNLNVEIN